MNVAQVIANKQASQNEMSSHPLNIRQDKQNGEQRQALLNNTI